MSGSIETTNPFRKTRRCELMPLSLADGTPMSRQRSDARLRQAASRCRMYSEHKHPGDGESTASESGLARVEEG